MDADTAEHTVVHCPAWREEREELKVSIGSDLSLPSLLRAMTDSAMAWDAVAKYACTVMKKKRRKQRETGTENEPSRKDLQNCSQDAQPHRPVTAPT